MTRADDETILTCERCGARNRVTPEMRRSGTVVCGRCKARLSVEADGGRAAPAHPVEANDGNFAEVVERSPLPVLLDLWAPWCPPCRALAPTIDALAAELAGRVRVAKLNVDESPRSAGRFRVDGIPTLLILKGGREVDRIVGLASKAQILQKLQPHA